jgi:hypothetical protein
VASWWGEIVLLFSVWSGLGRLSIAGVQELIEFDSDGCFVFLLGEKKRERNSPGGFLSQGWTHLADCAT